MNWLILRGLVREQRHWGKFPSILEAELRKSDPSAKVFCLDYPGFGAEADRASPNRIPEIVNDLRTRWLKLKEKESGEWNFFAMSLGGMNALEWCATHPEDFARLVLVNSSVSDFSPIHKRLKPKNYLSILALMLNLDLEKREQKILEMTTNLKGEALTQRARHNVSFALPVKRKDAIAQLTAAIRFRAPQELPVPLLVLVSGMDQLVDPSCSYEIARHYQAEVREHSSGNHDLPEDDPLWIAQQISNWLHTQGSELN